MLRINASSARRVFAVSVIEIIVILCYAAWRFHPVSSILVLTSLVLLAAVAAYMANPTTKMVALMAALAGMNLLVMIGYGIAKLPWSTLTTWPTSHPMVMVAAVCGSAIIGAVALHEWVNRGQHGAKIFTAH